MKHLTLVVPVVLAAVVGSACTMKSNEAPSFSGPSEFGQSITVSATPDAIVQDGASQSVVTVTAQGPNAEPIPNLSLRADIRVGGLLTDFGTISARNLVTNAQGRATLVYTAPSLPVGAAVDKDAQVQIGITPLGTDAANATTRIASVRLLPPGQVGPPNDLPLSFAEGSAASGIVGSPLAFSVVPPPGQTIVRYTWNFGDGTIIATTAPTASHTFNQAGTFGITVVAENAFGRTGTAIRSITIAPTAAPSAEFAVSPTDPAPNQTVRFNASASQPAAGRTIVSYTWDFGNGTTGTGVVGQASYAQIGTYTVTLTVTDDMGRRGVASKTVAVKVPTALR
jgi:PKD repeat protein